MPQKQAWSVESWQWDPYKLVAAPANEQAALQQKTPEGGSELSSSSSPTSSGDQPAKINSRPRGPPTCQVDGCITDLTGLKEYHNRYKICEFHLKIPSIVREGARQRFCQQCGRFHDLGEFDGDKRSCRARLQRHNARRRKKGDTETVKAPRKASASRQSKELLHSIPSRSASPVSDDAKTSSESPKPDGHFCQAAHQHHWQHAETHKPAEVHSQDWATCAQSTGIALENAFTDFLKHENAQQSMPCSVPMPAYLPDGNHPSTMTHQMVMENLLAECPMSDAAPSSDGMDMQYMPDMLAPPGPSYKAAHHPDFLHQASMHHEDQSTAPMSLMHQQALMAAQDRGYASGLQQQPHEPLSSWCKPPDMALQSMDLSVDGFSGMQFPTSPDYGHRQRRLLSMPQPQQHASQVLLTPKVEPSDSQPSRQQGAAPAPMSAVLDQARDLLAFTHSQPKYIPEEQFTRMSAKLFNCTPEYLPHDLKPNLVGLLSCGVDSIEGYIMPGCLQLTVDALMDSHQLEAMQQVGARQAVEQLLQGQNKAFWGSDAMLVQWRDELVLVKEGVVKHVVSGAGTTGLLPEIHSMTPVCVSNAQMGAVSITGTNISGQGQTVLCRSRGMYVPVEVSPAVERRASDLRQELKLHLPAGLQRGSVQVEVVCGAFISHAQPVLILENEEAVAEIQQLSTMPIPGMDVNSMLRDMGRVLEFSNAKQGAATGRQERMRHYDSQEQSIAGTTRRLLSFACQVGWVAVSELLLPIATAMGATASELVADLERVADEGLTLLHHIVRTRNASLVQVSLLLTWGINNGHEWDYAAAGPLALTPLHLAALLDDGGKVADELTDACAGALHDWGSLQAADGSTAADLASLSGAQSINAMIQRKLEGCPSGLQDQPYQFDPDTGEWLDDDLSLEPLPPVTDAAEAALTPPLIPTALPSNYTQLTSVQDPFVCREPQQSNCEPAESLMALSLSPSSSGYEEAIKPGTLDADVLYNGLHHRGNAKGNGNQLYDDEDQLYLEQKVGGTKSVPDVFDSRAALLSSAVVGSVGVVALGLRYCLECYGI